MAAECPLDLFLSVPSELEVGMNLNLGAASAAVCNLYPEVVQYLPVLSLCVSGYVVLFHAFPDPLTQSFEGWFQVRDGCSL
jgi:hypothetical protein